MIQEITQRILSGGHINKEEAIELTQISNKELLFQAADEIRKKFVGRKLDMCSITNAKSGNCSEDCSWCAQSSKFNTGVTQYEMISKKDAVNQARINRDHGVNRYSLVTSGRGISKKNLEELCDVYEEISKENDIKLCASMGIINDEKMQMLKDKGIGHYHCNLESSAKYFDKLCTTHTYQEKIDTIKIAQNKGISICSGGIIGMGETMEDRIEMAFELKNLNVQSIPINILNPIEGTPLEGTAKLTDEEIVTVFAIFRLINPKAHIRLAGGRVNYKHIEEKVLRAGVSSALVGDLLTTIGTNVEQDKVAFEKAGFIPGGNDLPSEGTN